ncbi:type II secretion system protein GspM [Orrella sp. JC864]|uniref:type II secretion system protein GspM n=1 Tax=Orrella sp. JC864 TaxID=3120298 RepID=UPI0012BD1431
MSGLSQRLNAWAARRRAPAAAQARWADLRRRAAAQWRTLSARERRLCAAAAAVLGAGTVWLFWAEPALRQISRWQAEIPRLQSQAAALEEVLRDVAPPSAGTASGHGDLGQALRQSLAQAGLAGRFALDQADGRQGGAQAGTVRVAFEAAPAHALMPWLLAGPGSLGLAVRQAQLQRDPQAQPDAPGTVTGWLQLASPDTLEEDS